jgi:hypothetical protein
MIPGANVLNMAFRVIAKTTITYYQYVSRETNVIGQDVTTYDAGTPLMGSWQPVQRNLYQSLGLDFQKSYYYFYVPSDLLDVSRDVSGDQIGFNGKRFQCESNTQWFQIDGWQQVLCVDIGVDL